jgi:hypothetical protein
MRRDSTEYFNVPVNKALYTDNLVYLADVLHGKIASANDLSSLENNLIVVKILSAARESAQSGKKILLKQ